MRLIFLDVDGVLNSVSFWITRYVRGQSQIDPEAVAYLNELTDQTGANLVISSAWRHRGIKEMRRILKANGVRASVVGLTPSLEHKDSGSPLWISPGRGIEIAAWLQASKRAVESFVILDDDNDMGDLLPRLVRTDYHIGLTPTDAMKARDMLEQPTPT